MTPAQFKQRVLEKYGPESAQEEHTEGHIAWHMSNHFDYVQNQLDNLVQNAWGDLNIIDLEVEGGSSES